VSAFCRSTKVSRESPVHALAGGNARTSNSVARFSSVFSKGSPLKVPKRSACYTLKYPCQWLALAKRMYWTFPTNLGPP
jgi:hypothetical protein